MLGIHPTHVKIYAAVVSILCFSNLTPQLLAKPVATLVTCYIRKNTLGVTIKDLEECSEDIWSCDCSTNNDIKLIVSNVTLKEPLSNLTLPSNVISFTAVDVNLTGSLPLLANSSRLQHLNLSSNDITGTLPDEWSRLTSLQALKLSSNNITGTLPAKWSTLTALKYVYLDGNPGLQGGIPKSWNRTGELQRVILPASTPKQPLPMSPPAQMRSPPPAYPAPILLGSNSSSTDAAVALDKVPLATAEHAQDPHNERVFRYIALAASAAVLCVIVAVTAYVLVRHYSKKAAPQNASAKHLPDMNAKHLPDLNAKQKPLVEAGDANEITIKLEAA